MFDWIQLKSGWLLWLFITMVIGGYLSYVMKFAEDKTALLPGVTTHGHYQIEMECQACHTNEEKENIFTSSGVSNAACNACHAESLAAFSDSHPTRKFKNPENAVFIQHINALECVTCHREHNEKLTEPMGVTMPSDYCAHCHKVTLENLESHKGLEFSSCATSGCHNYHDNMALAPSFLRRHYGEPLLHPEAQVSELNALSRWLADGNEKGEVLEVADADAPKSQSGDEAVLEDWAHSAHARAGINCSACHDAEDGAWVAQPDHRTCQSCHATEVADFLKGKHGMRLAHPGLSPMSPGMARQSMRGDASHRTLTCSSCHGSHRYDRQQAAHLSCLQCHNDTHSLNYGNSAHYRFWKAELAGEVPAGSGVSCATCHLPREKRQGDAVVVNHDQSANLRPSDKMLQSVCLDCHGLQFAMDALGEDDLVLSNFSRRPLVRHPGLNWAAESAIKRGDDRIAEIRKFLEAMPASGEGPVYPVSPIPLKEIEKKDDNPFE
ncbi:MAG: cytochrome c3 family protein [Verrucomicrobiota bacterium]